MILHLIRADALHALVFWLDRPGILFNNGLLSRIEASPIKELVLLDTIPYPSDKPACDKIKYLSVAGIFAEAIERIYEEVSISSLFD